MIENTEWRRANQRASEFSSDRASWSAAPESAPVAPGIQSA